MLSLFPSPLWGGVRGGGPSLGHARCNKLLPPPPDAAFAASTLPTRGRVKRRAPPYILNRTTFWRCSPSPSMPSVTTSPALRNVGGFMPSPTPGGVPVVITSPGSITKNCEQYQTMCGISKIIVLVLPRWRFSPFTSSHMSRVLTFFTSSLVTSQGPSGPKVSQPLPLVHWPPRSIWNCRSEPSLQTR